MLRPLVLLTALLQLGCAETTTTALPPEGLDLPGTFLTADGVTYIEDDRERFTLEAPYGSEPPSPVIRYSMIGGLLSFQLCLCVFGYVKTRGLRWTWLHHVLIFVVPTVFGVALLDTMTLSRKLTLSYGSNTIQVKTERLLPPFSDELTIQFDEAESVQVQWTPAEVGCSQRLFLSTRDGEQHLIADVRTSQKDLPLAEGIADHIAAALDVQRLPTTKRLW